MDRESILSIVRHILTFGGGFVVAKGWIDSVTLQSAIGAVITIVGVVWGIADKKARTP